MKTQETLTTVRGDEISFQIPEVLRKEFADDLRVVIRHPWIVGIPIPERLRPDVLKGLKDFSVVIAPLQPTRFATFDPVPPRQLEMRFKIPPKLANEFADDLRVVIRYPWIVGIPVPERLVPEVLRGLEGFDVVATPEEYAR